MTRGFSKFMTAAFALVLLGGVATPVVAQADTATKSVATTSTDDKQTYTIGSIELPYTQLVQNGISIKSYWYNKSTDDPTAATQPQTMTMDQLKDTDYMANFAAANNDKMTAQIGPAIVQGFSSINLSKGETVGEYIYALTDSDQTYDDFFDQLDVSSYMNTWLVKNLTLLKLNQTSPEELSADYQNELRPILVTTFSDNSGQLKQFDQLFGKPENIENLHDYLVKSFFTQYIQALHLDKLSDAERVTLDPVSSAAATKSLCQQPMSNFLTKQADGTYQLNTIVIFSAFYVFTDGSTVEKPVLPSLPDVTPDQSQPVTVHYVDDQGNQLAKDRTLTGDLDAAYHSDALTFSGYKLTQTPTNATGKFTTQPQSVTYVYSKEATLQTGSAAATVTPIAPKGTVVYTIKKIGLYKSATFTSKARKQWYAKKSRMNRPMFVVTGYAKSKNGIKRYRVKDVNHHSKTRGKTGYITTNRAYTSPVYYAAKHKTVTIINPRGVNSYAKQNLTGKKHHYRQGQTVKVKKIVRHNLTTRFVLSNGRYITANKKLVQAGRITMPKRIAAKGALNRYTTANLTKRNRHYTRKAQATFTVQGWDYSNANNFSKGDTLRYRVAGGYVSGNSQLVRQIR